MILKSPPPIFIFAGTSEGREIAEILSQKGFDCTVSVATEYGANLLPKAENLTVLQGRMKCEKMIAAFSQKNYAFVVDATHPFATEVSKEIKKACNYTHKKYLRLARNTNFEQAAGEDEKIFYFSDISQAGEWLQNQSGKIFVTTGSKELFKLCEKISERERLFVRVLPCAESLKICEDCKISENQIIALQGPFSLETNERQFAESGAKILLTKESGAAGGFFEKIQAAENLKMQIAVIKNPENARHSELDRLRCRGRFVSESANERSEVFHSVEEIVARIEKSS